MWFILSLGRAGAAVAMVPLNFSPSESGDSQKPKEVGGAHVVMVPLCRFCGNQKMARFLQRKK